MILKLGARYRSQVCGTEIIVVRAPGAEVDVRCGGQPVVSGSMPAGTVTAEMAGTSAPADDPLFGGTVMGKRYADGDLEVLVVKPGRGTLTADGRPLAIKEAKPLPSSD
jgi:hypothetical protein